MNTTLNSPKINENIADENEKTNKTNAKKQRNSKSFHLTIEEKHKFKEIIKDFDNIRYQAKKWTHKQFEILSKMNTKNTTNNTNPTILSNIIKPQENSKNAFSSNVFAKKKQEINKKLLEISDILLKTQEKSHFPAFNPAGIGENPIKNSKQIPLLPHLNLNTQHSPLVFPRNSLNEAKKQEIIQNKEKKAVSRTKGQLLSITTAISYWKIGEKSAKKQKKREKSLQIVKKRKTLKDLGKALSFFLNKLRKLKLCPREVPFF